MPARSGSRRAAAVSRKPTLSPTKFATFLECAVKYRYIYIDKIGRFYLRAKPYYSFGSTLHSVLEEFHAGGAEQTPEQLVEGLREGWIDAGYASVEQEREHFEAGEQIVQAYHAAFQEREAAKVETIATEKTLTCDMGRFRLSGRVDRLDLHPDGSIEIVDYKSGRWDVTPEEVASDLAMNIYQLILRKLYTDTRIFATIYCLRSGNSASAELDGNALTEFETDLRELADAILDTDYTAIEPVRLSICDDCEFLRRCDRYWRQQARIARLDADFYDG